MKKVLSLAAAVAVCAAVLTGCGGDNSQTGSAGNNGAGSGTQTPVDVVTFKYGHVDGTASSKQIFAERLNELLSEKLDGKYQLEIHSGSALGGERDLVEGVIMGTVDMTAVATTVAANFVPELNALELPYLFEDYDHVDAVFQGEIGQELIEAINEQGMVGLGFIEAGFRQFSNNTRPINSMEDIAGMRLRVMENAMHQALWAQLGADAVTMSWADGYTSIQQGAIDGIEVPVSMTYANNVQDVCRYMAMTDHIFTGTPIMISNAAFARIADADRETFLECVDEACRYAIDYNRTLCEDALQLLLDAGMEVTYPDLAPFREAMQSVYDQYPEYADMIARIKAAA